MGIPSRSHTRARVSRHGLRGLRLINNELGLWCCTPDRDRRLPAVRALVDHRRAASVLATTAAAQFLDLGHDGKQVRCEIAAYRANKRCSLRVKPTNSLGNGGVFVKVFRRAPTGEQVEALRLLPPYLDDLSSGRVRAPAIIDFCPAKRLLITAAVTEASCPLGTSPEALSAAATALAILHELPAVTATKIHTARDEFQTACRWGSALRVLREPRHVRLRKLLVDLSRQAATIEEQGTTLIHRDFFPAQLLWAGKTLWVLDFDTLCLGHSEVDVATFVAHLLFDGLIAGTGIPEITRMAASFVEDYLRNGGRISKSRLRFYLPCALARLGAIHLPRGVPVQVVDQLWELADGHLAGSWRLG